MKYAIIYSVLALTIIAISMAMTKTKINFDEIQRQLNNDMIIFIGGC